MLVKIYKYLNIKGMFDAKHLDFIMKNSYLSIDRLDAQRDDFLAQLFVCPSTPTVNS